MDRRIGYLALLLATTACSQRSPWVVSAPAPGRASGGTRQQAETASVALATAAPAPADATATADVGSLFFPVSGIDSTRLDDSFDDARDGGARRHNAIDIMAPRGTPVLSVQDGRVLRLSTNDKGGITVYATDLEERFVFYYAHLDGYHERIYTGRLLMRGDTLGYVGTTGNAPDNAPHLHFQVMRMPADGKYWDGEPINPYPLLRNPGSESPGR